MGEAVVYEQRENGVAILTLNRPEKMNALSGEIRQGLLKCIRQAQEDDQVRVIIITGSGKAFSAGGDVKEIGRRQAGAGGLDKRNQLQQGMQAVALYLANSVTKPVLAAVNGLAVGGGFDLTLMCDIRIASDKARFAEAYINLATVPAMGGAYFLPRLIGTAKALELFWTGSFISAVEAERIGLVNKVVPSDDLLDYTVLFASAIAEKSPLAVEGIKRLVYQGVRVDLGTSLDLASKASVILSQTADHVEGVTAVIEKRKPIFRGE